MEGSKPSIRPRDTDNKTFVVVSKTRPVSNAVASSSNVKDVSLSEAEKMNDAERRVVIASPAIAIKKDPLMLEYVPHTAQTRPMVISCVTREPLSLAFVAPALMSPDVIDIALRKNGLAIGLLEEPTVEQCFVAVASEPMSLALIKKRHQNGGICKAAVRGNPVARQFVRVSIPA